MVEEQMQLEAEANQQTLIEKVVNWFRQQSIFVLAYGTGCGAIEVPPTMTARYDAERFGFRGAATPRQADVLVVSGYLSTKTLKRVIRTYEQMQAPKFVVALGSCTINGGMYWDSYNTVKQVENYLPVDVYVTGCMPRPEALLAVFGQLQKKIAAGQADGWEKYQKEIETYKANQRKVLGDNMNPTYTSDWYHVEGASLG